MARFPAWIGSNMGNPSLINGPSTWLKGATWEIPVNLKGIDYEQRSLVLRAGEQRHPDYLKLNPQARVPTLIDGTIVLTQSQAIVEYLEERHPEPRLLPNDIAQRARVRALAAVVACDIHPANNLMILEVNAHWSHSDQNNRGFSRRHVSLL